jgi:hypothetical protein
MRRWANTVVMSRNVTGPIRLNVLGILPVILLPHFAAVGGVHAGETIGPVTIDPVTIGPGLLRQILRDCDLTHPHLPALL